MSHLDSFSSSSSYTSSEFHGDSSGEEQDETRVLNIPPLPAELHNIIAEDVSPPPKYYNDTIPKYSTLVFPKNPRPRKVDGHAYATAHPVLAPIVTPKFWKHVVVRTDSHVKNILDRPFTPPRTGMYRSTLRCDVHLPFTPRIHNMNLFFASFPNLQTIVWEYPPLNCITKYGTAPCDTVTTLQLGTLPLGFGHKHVDALDFLFPSLWSLQVLDTPSVDFQSGRSSTRTLFRNLSFLAVGTPWHFMPSKPYHENSFLSLLEDFPPGSLCPLLQELHVEHHVLISETFFERHAKHITTLAYGSNNVVFFEDEVVFSPCTRLTTLIICVNPDSLEYPPLPDTVDRIVVVQPILPSWRIVKHMEFHLHQCLEQIWTMPENFATEIWCEARGVLSYVRRRDEIERWAGQGVAFRILDFGAFPWPCLPHKADHLQDYQYLRHVSRDI